MERDTNRDRDRGTVRVTGKKYRGTGTGTEGQGQWDRRTGRGAQIYGKHRCTRTQALE